MSALLRMAAMAILAPWWIAVILRLLGADP